MIYFGTASGAACTAAMDAGILGQITTPRAGNQPAPGRVWCADNGVFGGAYPGDDKFLAWLGRWAHLAGTCRFAAAPDVVGDAVATLARSAPMLPRIRALGYPAALVAQDGLEDLPVPWDDFDVLFLGGSTEWKLSAAARRLTAQARERGKWVHMGRVNSKRRFLYAAGIGCQSADGTFLAFAPDTNLVRLAVWQQAHANMLPMESLR